MGRLPAPPLVRRIVEAAVAEDLGGGDLTTDALMHPASRIRAVVEARAAGVICGGQIARTVFEVIDPDVLTRLPVTDGSRVERGGVVLDLEGSSASILGGERTALNFLQHLSGIATLTARYVAAIEGTGAVIVDTRKTLPGLSALQKYAVASGGARNHRTSAGDGILIKDNHISVLRAGGEALIDIVARARSAGRHSVRVEVEVEDLDQLREALEGAADVVMLDNMDIETMREAVAMAAGSVVLEASGGVDLESVRDMAETGVDFISVGALTHSAPALDMSLRVL